MAGIIILSAKPDNLHLLPMTDKARQQRLRSSATDVLAAGGDRWPCQEFFDLPSPQQLPDPTLWTQMLEMARNVPNAISAVKKRLPDDLKESVWACITKGVAKKTDEFLAVAEQLDK